MGKIFYVFIITCFFIACDNATVAGDTHTLSGNSWDVDEKIDFEIPVLDSIKQYDVFVNVRNTNEYPFNNLFLIVSMQYPNGKTAVDTLEYKMAAPDGSWLGEGIGSIKESKLYYKENFSFRENGNYSLGITHAVRNNGNVQGVKNLQGISDVGYSVEVAKNK
ncbi:gliding motility lipoprotein GldH [Patiriisocius marinistellae]|uniref:Gliding motility lipoprotein GldH n=1 Tax=Patiriisocius marinistellae TaxID=2494560 RepID=A0A5J4FXQ8_9FLAO|nr:gliding motility lipoprotein GldH [Patiriisocius marinistellae]GEQ84805.1 gliding motility lipoprotein GldH [Patiriisocius marinistellae]